MARRHDVAGRPGAAIVAALGPRTIVLVGMMGAGKSSIGRRLALRLGIPFVDADTEIEKAAGMTIPDIFAVHGEADFRAGEARVIAAPAGERPAGAGDRRRRLHECGYPGRASRAKGISIWLKAEFDVLMKRIKRRHDRPAAQDRDPGATLRKLMEERYPIYALADLTVQSREVTHEKIVDEIVSALAGQLGAACASRRARRRRPRAMTAPLRASDPIVVNVALGERSYDIVIGRGLLASLGQRIAALRPGAKAAIVTDETVARHHLAAAEAALAAAGIAATSVIVPPGESSKSFPVLERVCEALIAARIERGDLVRGARRRRHRRSRRLCGRGPAPRPRLRAGADHAAGAGRFLGRRQDRDQFQPRQEPGRRIPSADPGARRHGAARHPAAARIPRRLCRSRQIRPARRRRLLRLAGSELARRVRGRARRASMPSR